MRSYSLSVYRIRIYRQYKKEETVNLSDYDYGKCFLNQVDDLFSSWKIKEDNPIKDENVFKKVSRLKKDGEGEWIYHKFATYIDGIIESGEYGTQEEIIDIRTGESKYTKTKNDATLVPFYFMIYVEQDSNEAYLLLERIGNDGIFSVIKSAITKSISPQLTENYTISIEPYLVPEILNINFNAAGGAKKIILKGIGQNQFKDFQSDQILEGCHTEISFIAPKNKMFNNVIPFINALNKRKNNNEPLKVNNIECQDVSFELNILGRPRIVTVANLTKIGMNVDISKLVKIEEQTGYPSYKSLNEEAHIILSYILKNGEK